MCAIFGTLGDFSRQKQYQAFESLQHRGPDEKSIYESENLFFAHHRLAIVDAKHEQISHVSGVHVAFNGEIYNYQELKKVLSEYPFTGEGESELILAAYLTWGEACVDRFEGMFAIALWDSSKQKLLLFRDRLGKKPLYYYQGKEGFVFSSEIKAFTMLGLKLSRSQPAEQSFVSFQTALAPYTFYQEISALQAGQMLTLDKGRVSLEFYDDILPKQLLQSWSPYDFKELVMQSVHTRLPKANEAVFLLSGGVDSSLLCAIAQEAYASPIQTFSLGYEGDSRYDETSYAKEVADYIGAKNERIVYTFEDFKEDLEDPFKWTDQPLNDPAIFPLAHLFKSIRAQSDAKIVMSGEGSDELFLGYRPYKELAEIELLGQFKHKSWLKNYFLKHPDDHREWEWYRRVLEDEILFRSSAESFTPKQKAALLSLKDQYDVGFETIHNYYKSYRSCGIEDPLLWYRYIDLKVHQSDYFLLKLDRVSMHYGIEARTPFLDETLVKKTLQSEGSLFLDAGIHKKMLKELAKEYLPLSIVNRKKRGFSYPFITWLEEAGGFKTIRQLNEKHKIFDAKVLKGYLQQAAKGGYKQHVFGIYLLLRWVEKH